MSIDTNGMPASFHAAADKFFSSDKKERFRSTFTTAHVRFTETDEAEKVINQMDEFLKDIDMFMQKLKISI